MFTLGGKTWYLWGTFKQICFNLHQVGIWSLWCTYFGVELGFIAEIILEKYPWCMTIQFHSFEIWCISTSILSKIVWKAPASSRSSSGLTMFPKIDPWCFGQFGKFQDTKNIYMYTAPVSKRSFCFLWLYRNTQFLA